MIVVLFIPKILGVEQYGYWQLYIFYIGYVGFLHLGIPDGMYLRYGGENYEDLNFRVLTSQFWLLCISQIIILFLGIIVFNTVNINVEKSYIIMMTCICAILVIPKTMLIIILQATNKIKEYALIMIIDRVVYLFMILFVIIMGVNNYKVFILIDLIAKMIALIYACICCKEIVFGKFDEVKSTGIELKRNINIGIKLMIANIASTLIIGNVRLGIERKWDVSTFGKVSLTISISNMLMVFINALSIIMFPMLKRTKESRLPEIYIKMRTVLITTLLGVLMLYYPARLFLSKWLPQYQESLRYMALLFPMCIFESKIAMLIMVYLKTLRKEKTILLVNIFTVFLSIFITLIAVFLFESLPFAILAIVFLLAFRSIFAEILLSRMIKINVKKDILLEVIMTSIFIFSSWNLEYKIGVVVYIIAYSFYLVIKKSDIKEVISFFIKKDNRVIDKIT